MTSVSDNQWVTSKKWAEALCLPDHLLILKNQKIERGIHKIVALLGFSSTSSLAPNFQLILWGSQERHNDAPACERESALIKA